jgi:uncharacterized membrane protein
MKFWIVSSLALTFVEAVLMSYVGFIRSDLVMEKIPIHWDIQMNPDGWTDREHFCWYLLIAPGVMLFMIGLMAVLPWLSPRNFEIDRFVGTFGFLMTALVVFFAYLGVLTLWAGIEENPPYWYWWQCFAAGFFIMFAEMGSMMGKVQCNFFVGIRTPWTLASETVWNRTHRVAARLWSGAGLAGGVLVMRGVPFWVGLILMGTASLVPVLYSLVLYESMQKHGEL